MREKLGRRLALLVSLENSTAFFAFERHLPAVATEPSERGGWQERRIGLLNEAGRTEGRSKAKDCANVSIVVRRRPRSLRSCGPPQRV
jgi:hypothetical protein